MKAKTVRSPQDGNPGTNVPATTATVDEVIVPLTHQEKADLAENERIISKGLSTFVEVGLALQDTRDRKLYRGEHKTFEEYCRKKWHMARQHAYRMIGSAGVVRLLSPIGDKMPVPRTESQVRPLLSVLSVDQEKLPEIWQKACEKAGDGKVPTAKLVTQTVKEVLGETAKPSTTPKKKTAKAISGSSVKSILGMISKIKKCLEKDEVEDATEVLDQMAKAVAKL